MKNSPPSSRRPAPPLASLAIAGVALSLAATPRLSALVVNDFESGTFGVNSAVIGDSSIVDANFFTPASGTRQALVTTFSTAADGGNASGTDAATANGVENFLGLSSGTLQANGASNGDASAFTVLRLSLNVGDMVSFNYDFLTNATAADGQDFSFVTLQRGGADSTFLRLTGVSSASQLSNSSYFNLETGSRTLSLAPVTTAGLYTLGFGVTDAFDDSVGSGLLIDNIQVNAVPEPSTFVGVAGIAGLGWVVAFRRRRNVSRA